VYQTLHETANNDQTTQSTQSTMNNKFITNLKDNTSYTSPHKKQPATIKHTTVDVMTNQAEEVVVGSSHQHEKTKQGIARTTQKQAPEKSTARSKARAGGTLNIVSIRDYPSMLSGST
jgi:hypothetical protein